MAVVTTRRDRLYLGFSLLLMVYVYGILFYHLIYQCKWLKFFKYLTNWTFFSFTMVFTVGLVHHFIYLSDLQEYSANSTYATMYDVLSFMGFTIRVVYLFVGLAYYLGLYVSHKMDAASAASADSLSFIDISKHCIFVLISLAFQFIVRQPHFEVMIGHGVVRIFTLSAFYCLSPIVFLYIYGIFYLTYYYKMDHTSIYLFHNNSVRPVFVTGIVTLPYCYLTTILMAFLDVYIKNRPEYIEWMS